MSLACGGESTGTGFRKSEIDLSSPFEPFKDLVSISLVGDVNLGDGVASYISSNGVGYPWWDVEGVLRSTDLAFANLECALSNGGQAVAGKSFCFRGSPECAAGMAEAGIDVVSLANNHSKDFGDSALSDTLSVLTAHGIAHCGAGENRAEALRPAVLEAGGKKVAFVAFCDILPYDWPAGESSPGVASDRDTDQVAATVRAGAEEADYVVASFHWGVELSTAPNSTQKNLAHLAVDSGADLVVGHHPHVVQGLETYKGRLIAYSLGNFVFSPPREISSLTLILKACLGPEGLVQAKVVPVRISRCRPVVMDASDGGSWLSRVREYCADLGTGLIIEGNSGYVVGGSEGAGD